jgi:hypothetical protein
MRYAGSIESIGTVRAIMQSLAAAGINLESPTDHLRDSRLHVFLSSIVELIEGKNLGKQTRV